MTSREFGINSMKQGWVPVLSTGNKIPRPHCHWTGNFSWSWKVSAIQSYPVPTNLKKVQWFLGLAGQICAWLLKNSWTSKCSEEERKTIHLETRVPKCVWPVENKPASTSHSGSSQSQFTIHCLYRCKWDRARSCSYTEKGCRTLKDFWFWFWFWFWVSFHQPGKASPSLDSPFPLLSK